MDIATFLGILSAFGLLAIAIMTRGEFSIFFDISSLLVVLGGTFGATLINYPMKDLVRVMRVVKNVFFHVDTDYVSVIPDMVRYSKLARRDGVLALDKVIEEVDDQFFYEGLRLIVDGTKPEVIREVLRNEIDFLAARHRVGISMFKAMGQYAPAFGMIGTLIGLILMLRSLNDVNQIASSMALALITTFYGAILANILFLPIAGKLKERSEAEILKKEMILAGILSIQSGEVPGMVEQRMVSFLPTEYRRIYMKENVT
ncbi:MAG TPA: MotA/TolQ/ExbB proton channel family protein [Candidatus Deferrimicrobium sp.]|nr:MotA/TolQ/ExbB proton channel family protein [Candidatus Deferrimicrobium sp.]